MEATAAAAVVRGVKHLGNERSCSEASRLLHGLHLRGEGGGRSDDGLHRVVQGAPRRKSDRGDVAEHAAGDVEATQVEEALGVGDVEERRGGGRGDEGGGGGVSLAHKQADAVAEVVVAGEGGGGGEEVRGW